MRRFILYSHVSLLWLLADSMFKQTDVKLIQIYMTGLNDKLSRCSFVIGETTQVGYFKTNVGILWWPSKQRPHGRKYHDSWHWQSFCQGGEHFEKHPTLYIWTWPSWSLKFKCKYFLVCVERKYNEWALSMPFTQESTSSRKLSPFVRVNAFLFNAWWKICRSSHFFINRATADR